MDTSRESFCIGRDEEPQSGERLPSPWIIVADPDEDIRCRVAAALHADGYTVIEASNGVELLYYLTAPLPDREIADELSAVIMTPWMSGVSGLTIVGALRDANWTTPIMLLTEPLNLQLRRTYLRLGANAIIEKPFDVDDLRTMLRDLVLACSEIRNSSRYNVLQHADPAQAIPHGTFAKTG